MEVRSAECEFAGIRSDPVVSLAFAFADATLAEIAGGRTFRPLDEPERLADEILR